MDQTPAADSVRRGETRSRAAGLIRGSGVAAIVGNREGRSGMNPLSEHRLAFIPIPKRIRVTVGGETLVDSLAAGLLLERGRMPVYYFPRRDVRADLLAPAAPRGVPDALKGEAAWWSVRSGDRRLDHFVWGHDQPPAPEAAPLAGRLAVDWDRADHRFEEDEEVWGHARDPFHRIDVRASAREVTATFAGETVARTRRALFLFETGLPPRYYFPAEDVRQDLLVPSATRSVCPYKGFASYWSLRVGEREASDAVWCYRDPLPEMPRIKGHVAFWPERHRETLRLAVAP
jgi:uncharacterized protein (DUF427 family)